MEQIIKQNTMKEREKSHYTFQGVQKNTNSRHFLELRCTKDSIKYKKWKALQLEHLISELTDF